MQQIALAIQWINIFIILGEALIVFINMKSKLHHFLFMSCICVLTDAVGYLLVMISNTEEAFFHALVTSWVGKVCFVIFLFQFCVRFSQVRVPRPVSAILGLFAVATIFAVATTREKCVFYKDIRFEYQSGQLIFHHSRGAWCYLWSAVLVILIFFGFFILSMALSREKNALRKKQFRMMIAALAVDGVIGTLGMLTINEYYDLSQLGFSISAILVLIAIFKFKLMDTGVLARDFIADDLSSCVIALDTGNRLAYHNKAALEVFPELENDTRDVIERVQYSVSTGEPLINNGRMFKVEEKVLIQNGQEAGKIYVLTDSTENYRHIRELEEQKRIANDANKAKSDFLARMSHEIRTPINTVLGMDEMILRESMENKVKEYALDIQAAGRALLSLINDILDLSTIESGKMDIVPVEYDTAGLIDDLLTMITIAAKEKKILFRVEIDPELPSKLQGDELRIRQVLTNILTNAVKYTEHGSVTFRVDLRNVMDEAEGVWKSDDAIVHFEVEDTGIGIRQDEVDKLFKNFEKIEMEDNPRIEGSKLGMTITMKILAMMGSKLRIKSEYQKGSVFSFDLVQRIVNDEPIGDYNSKIRKSVIEQYSKDKKFKAPGAHILIVDDTSANRKVFVSLLHPTEIKITEASGGEEAIKLASEIHFDIIFMDHMMPGMDGIEAMREIRKMKDGPCAGTPIFVLTANAVAGSREMYMQEGFDGFLSKPISYNRLENVIKNTLPREKIQSFGDDEPKASMQDLPGTGEGELPVIFGLDWELALMRLQSRDSLVPVLTAFKDTLDVQADKLDGFKNDLPAAVDDYRIMVHGMKSASGSAGIFVLSGMAAVLEKAANEHDYDTINAMHDVFIREWRRYRERLKSFLGSDATAKVDRPEIKTDVLKALLELLSSAVDNMDIGAADDAMKKLSAFKIPDGAKEEFEELKSAVAEFDSEQIHKTIARLNERM